MDLIDLEDDQIDAEVLNSLAVTMENFRVNLIYLKQIFLKCKFKFLLFFSMPWVRAAQVL